MINFSLLETIVPSGSMFKPENKRFFCTFSGDFTKEADFYRLDSELNRVHPQLAIAMRMMALDDLIVKASRITTLLLIWDSELIVTAHNGGSYVAREVESLQSVDGGLKVKGTFFSFNEEKLPGTQETIKLPGSFMASSVNLTTEWLSQQNSQWRKRLAIASDIGLDPAEMLKSILVPHSSEQSLLPPTDLAL